MVLRYVKQYASIEHKICIPRKSTNDSEFLNWLRRSDTEINALQQERDNVGASECNSLSYMRESKFKDWGLTLRLSSSMSKK